MNFQRKISFIAFVILLAGIAMSFNSNAQTVKIPKFGKGIKFEAADTSMGMTLHLRMQNLFEGGYSTLTNETNTNFSTRRYRLKFDGFALNPNLRYKMELGISNRDQGNSQTTEYGSAGSNIILDAVIKYKFNKGHWDLWAGQTKLPGNRERVVSSANLQFVDRSNVNSLYNLDRDQGIQLHGNYSVGGVVIKPIASWSMGEGRNITSVNFGGFDYTGRVEVLPFGEFEGKNADYVLSDLDRQSKPKLAIGATYDYNDRAARQGGQLGNFVLDSTKVVAENTLSTVFVDLIFKYKGFSFLSEYANKQGNKKIDGLKVNYLTGSGFTAQAGYLTKKNYEVAFRYTEVSPDDKKYSAVKEQTEYTIGLSKYIVGHSLKIQADYSYFNTPTNEKHKNDHRARVQIELQL